MVAADRALYRQADRAWARLGWDQVGRVDWDEQRHVLMLTGLAPTVAAGTVLRLAGVWGLRAAAAERVSWAKVVDLRVHSTVVPGRGWSPGGAGIRWLVILDHGLDPADPGVRARAGARR